MSDTQVVTGSVDLAVPPGQTLLKGPPRSLADREEQGEGKCIFEVSRNRLL